MSGFPKLIPAFTAQFALDEPNSVGSLSKGQGLAQVTLIPGLSTLRSEPDYPIKIDATAIHGADYIKTDPDGGFARLDVQSLVKDKATGGLVRLSYTGIIDLTGPCGKVLRHEPGAGTCDFGGAFTHLTFETGEPQLKPIESKVYVSAGRFIVEPGKPPFVEYKISQVAY